MRAIYGTIGRGRTLRLSFDGELVVNVYVCVLIDLADHEDYHESHRTTGWATGVAEPVDGHGSLG